MPARFESSRAALAAGIVRSLHLERPSDSGPMGTLDRLERYRVEGGTARQQRQPVTVLE